jgi:hypothetical protein
MEPLSAAGHEQPRALVALWTAFLAGPVAWALNQGIGYAVMKPVCGAANAPMLWLIAVVTLAIGAAGGAVAFRHLRALRAIAHDNGRRIVDRSYFLAAVALALNALIALLIVTSVIPQFLLSPCE